MSVPALISDELAWKLAICATFRTQNLFDVTVGRRQCHTLTRYLDLDFTVRTGLATGSNIRTQFPFSIFLAIFLSAEGSIRPAANGMTAGSGPGGALAA